MRVVATWLIWAGLAWGQAGGPEQVFAEALAAQQRGDDAGAIAKYQQLVKAYPKVVEVRANLGAVLAKVGRLEEAILQYRTALELAPGNAGLESNLALAYYKKGDYVSALRRIEGLRRGSPGDVRLALLAAECYQKLGQAGQVVAVLAPLEGQGDLGLAWMLGNALIQTGRAREGLKRVVAVAEKGRRAEAYLLAGQTALGLEEFELARDYAEAAGRLDGKLAGLETLRGRVLQYLSDNAGAMAALRRAVAADEKDFEAQLNLGAVLYTERQMEEARVRLEKALALRPESAAAHYQMGRLERTEGHLEAAARHLEMVVQAEPGWAQAHVELSAVYFRMGRQADGEREKAEFDRLNQKGGPPALLGPAAR